MAGPADLSTMNAVMKIVYGKLAKQHEEEPYLYNKIAKGAGTKISDRGYEIPTHLDGNYNYTFTTDGGNLPAGGGQLVKRAQVFFKNQVHACQLTGGAIDAINGKDVAYVSDVLQWNLDETVKSAHKMANWHAWGTGNGRLATISSGAGSVTQTVSNNDKNRALHNGTLIEITDGTTSRGTAVIDNAKASSTTFTLLTSLTSTTSDIVVPAGGYNLATTGIRQMVDDTTDGTVMFQSLSRNTYPSYRAFRVDAGSTGIDPAYLRRLLGAGIHISAGKLNRKALELWSHPAQTAAYSALGWNLKRFTGESKSIDLGFTTYEYEGISWSEDVDAPKDEIDAFDFSTFGKYVAKEFGWDDKTGAILRQVPGTIGSFPYTDNYIAFLTARYNFGCTKPNANGWVDALAIPTGF